MIVQNWQIPLQAVLSKLFVRPNFCFMQYKMSAEMLRHKMKSTTQIVFSWSLYVYLSEGWKCLFLRYKTDMHKSISESSKEETDRAQKVYVGWLLFFGRLWSSGSFMGYFHLPYLLFPWRRKRVSDPVTNTFWITNSVPARAAAAGFALWRWEKCLGRGPWCWGCCQRRNGNAASESGPTTCITSLQLPRLERAERWPAEYLALRFEAWSNPFFKCDFILGSRSLVL